ncbi:hypothetical protein CIG75_05075 [Tumebacillus algifaecis]|uniref:Uncharacterized protein n=1 Tax=Tumebacillus algifaecis TaxID=1214604 RepID=A0A223CYE5_9BACL|nr:hypothetical protein [Tumebacillus algifaecis]ASS74420.1 hypothetical protein CIG75_05075 [Tumebacillus algifaecis]
MHYTVVPIIQDEPLTLGAEHLPLDGSEGERWKKAIQSLHPRLLPSLKENALLSEEDSEFCVAGGIFDYERGRELVFDGTELRLSHCAENFFDFLMAPVDCLHVLAERQEQCAEIESSADNRARLAVLTAWWEQGYRVLMLQHQ